MPNVQRQSLLEYEKARENCKLSFEWIFKCQYRSSLLATIIAHFCKYYHNLSFQRVCVFQRNRGKKWNVVFLIQNEVTIKYDRF